MTTTAFCEVDPFCRAVLAHRFPGVYLHDDIRTLTADTLWRRGITPDICVGGFPCQDLSIAGKRAGLEGAQSGLWFEYHRIICEVRPRWVIVENVTGLLSAGMGRVLGDLAASGYDALWDCIPASAVGAKHQRDRIWIVAHASGVGQPSARHAKLHSPADGDGQADRSRGGGEVLPNADTAHGQRERLPIGVQAQHDQPRHDLRQPGTEGRDAQPRLGRMADGVSHWMDPADWMVEPEGIPRIAKGIENRAQRLMALGNAVVPQVVWEIGKAIMAAEAKLQEAGK